MGNRSAAIISFRLGGGDGVSIEAAKWGTALAALGFEVTTVAGTGTADKVLPGLAIDATEAPTRTEIEDALAPADLVVVENLCSLPLNPAAGSVVADALRGRRAVMHHHDLPWQRDRFAGYPPPPDDPTWLHVTINQISRLQLASRDIRATVIRNTFEVDSPPGDRTRVRDVIEVSEDEIVVLQPTRAIPRKNVQAGVELCEHLGATYWLLGPAEDGFGPDLDQLLRRARCRVVTGHAPGLDESGMSDTYAAADVVTLPSTWEGFGNPAIESAIHHRPLAIGHYPVAAELAAFGFIWLASDDPGSVAEWLDQRESSSRRILEHNFAIARAHFSFGDLPERLEEVLRSARWGNW